MRDLYEILGVQKTALPDEIRSAYRKRAAEINPNGESGGSEEDLRELIYAGRILRNPELRKKYDLTGKVEEKASLSAQQLLVVFLSQVFDQIVSSIGGTISLEQTNIIQRMQDIIQQKVGETQKIQSNLKTNIAVLEKIRSKIKAPETGEVLLIKIIDGKLSNMREAFTKNEPILELQQNALEELGNYSTIEEFVEYVNGYTIITTSGFYSNSTTF